jgi:hypothetical protein
VPGRHGRHEVGKDASKGRHCLALHRAVQDWA